ncbi:MAG: hypothetical protein QM650_17085 [Microlunatus sp.]
MRHAIRDEYARQVGRSLGDIDYFEVLTTARWLLNVLPAAAVWEDFRTFLVDPVRRAQQILSEHIGLEVHIRLEP